MSLSQLEICDKSFSTSSFSPVTSLRSVWAEHRWKHRVLLLPCYLIQTSLEPISAQRWLLPLWSSTKEHPRMFWIHSSTLNTGDESDRCYVMRPQQIKIRQEVRLRVCRSVPQGAFTEYEKYRRVRVLKYSSSSSDRGIPSVSALHHAEVLHNCWVHRQAQPLLPTQAKSSSYLFAITFSDRWSQLWVNMITKSSKCKCSESKKIGFIPTKNLSFFFKSMSPPVHTNCGSVWY